jgi:hypothetical protein
MGEEGAVYLGGATRSADFPTTPGAFDTALNDDYDAYIIHLNSSINMLEYSVFLPIVMFKQETNNPLPILAKLSFYDSLYTMASVKCEAIMESYEPKI